jgi:hypothetical protein
MANLILEIEQSYDNKIAALEREIERLREKKTIMISSLQEDIGDREFKSPQMAFKSKQVVIQESIPFGKKINTRDRLLLALEKMPLPGFTTSDLFMSANNDGYGGKVNKNRASKVFKTLIDEGIVEVDKYRHGRQGGIYKKVIKQQTPHPLSVRMVRTKGSVSAIQRISDALDSMEGEFASADLWNTASNDGRGPEIPKTSFHPKFSKMLKEGLAITVQKQSGGTPGIYRKAERKQAESSPASKLNFTR